MLLALGSACITYLIQTKLLFLKATAEKAGRFFDCPSPAQFGDSHLEVRFYRGRVGGGILLVSPIPTWYSCMLMTLYLLQLTAIGVVMKQVLRRNELHTSIGKLERKRDGERLCSNWCLEGSHCTEVEDRLGLSFHAAIVIAEVQSLIVTLIVRLSLSQCSLHVLFSSSTGGCPNDLLSPLSALSFTPTSGQSISVHKDHVFTLRQ